MKKFVKAVGFFCCMLLTLTFIACKGSGKDLVLSADKTSVEPGKTVTFSAIFKDEEGVETTAEDVTYEIVSGEDHGTISQNVLTINTDAELGAEIKVSAKVGSKTSNEVKIKVSIPLEGIAVSANGVTTVLPQDFIKLTKVLNPELSDVKKEDVSWVVEEGASICNIVGDNFYVNPQAKTGQKIKIKAQYGDIVSNSLTFTVGYPLQSMNIMVLGSANVPNGSSRQIICQTNPDNATDVNKTFEFLEGETLCSIVNDIITINNEATIGSKIRFKAVCEVLGDDGVLVVESNEVSLTVGTPIETITIRAIGYNNDESIKILKTKTNTIGIKVTPDGAITSGVELFVSDGAEYASIDDDNNLVVKSTTPYGSIIKVQAKNGTIFSNELVFQYGIGVESVSLNTLTPIIYSGKTAELKATVSPADATAKDTVSYVITEGNDKATITGSTIVFNNGVKYGTIVKVKAICDGKESTEISVQYGVGVESVSLNTLTPIIYSGKTAELKAVVSPSDATAKDTVSYVITEGNDKATITGSTIVFNNGVKYGTIVKVKAICDGKESTEISVQHGIAVTSVELSTLTPIVKTGRTAVLSANVVPNNATEKNNVNFVITQGSEYADIVSNTILFKENVGYGTVVKVKAICDGKESTEISVQYGIAVTSVQINEPTATEIVKGNSVILSATVLPEDATDSSVIYEILEGSTYANIIGNVLTIKSDAETGEVVKIKAVSVKGNVSSNNVVTFIIKATKEEEQAEQFILSLSDDRITLDRHEGYIPVLTVDVYNFNFQKVQDKEIKYTVVDGAEFVKTTANGYSCNFEILGHGQAVVEVSIAGTNVKENVIVNAIVPPQSIRLPEVFAERVGYVYNFSKINPKTSAAESLPFVASVTGTKVCESLKYTFMHEDGTSGSSVAEYSNGKITFNKTGKVTVIISSDSGSKVETTNSYSFNINEGYNVYTFGEFQKLAISNYYKGEQINIVVLERPDGSANNYEYGFDLVSPAGLIAKEAQTFADVYGNGGQKIIFPNRSGYINGNKHKIDLSQVKVITKEELQDNNKAEVDFWPAIISFIPWKANLQQDEILTGTYDVKIYDLEVIGNCPIDYDGDLGIEKERDGKPIGVFYAGITIGNRSHHAKYYVDMKNISVSQCENGIEIAKIVGNGLLENIYAYNCYTNGIEVASSIVRLKDVKFGKCGAAGIELIQGSSNEAGENFNENQTVTFEGSLDVSGNHTDGQTNYFNNYIVAGQFTIPQVIQMVLNNGNYNTNQQNHMQEVGSENPYVFICFNLVDMGGSFAPNTSVCNYPGYQQGGIIKATDLPKEGYDTTHQYIELDVDFGMGSFGKVLLYNHYYGK